VINARHHIPRRDERRKMTIAKDLNSVLNKIAAAQVAVRILRPTSWYDRPDWELNDAQQASMRKTISKAVPAITEDRLKWFAQQTCFAIGDLQAAGELECPFLPQR
jgi:hypothetical protein